MPLAALLPLLATLLGLWAGGVALGFRGTRGWEPFRDAAWPAFCASAYCFFDVVITFPALGRYSPLFAPLQTMAVGGFLWSLSRYLPAVAGPGRSDRVMGWWGLVVAVLGALCLVPGLGFAPVATHRDLAWLHSTYTEAYPRPFGQAVLTLGWLGLTLPIARTFADLRRAHPTGRLHFVGISLMMLTGGVDLVTTTLHTRMPYILSLGFILAIVYGGRAIFAHFASYAADLAVQTRSLTQAIDERTKELVSTEEQLQRAQKLASLGQLAAGVAHEVNNPAAAVVANLTYVLDAREREGTFPTDAVTSLQESVAAMGRVTRIVRQLLDAGRAGAKHEVLEPVDLARAVESAVAIVRAQVPANVRVRSTVEQNLSVKAREDLLVQALVNLLTNAVQAVPADVGGVVTVSARPTGRRIVLVVEDDGSGMTEEVRARIFEPFFTTKGQGKGTGLGLSVTLGIIRSLGGEISVESQQGEGTRVSIDLRAARGTGTSQVFRHVASVAPPRRLRLLVIDDERLVREALQRVLKRKYDVRVVGGVDEALEELGVRPDADIILCDALMPEGGGERVYKTLQERSPALARRVVFVTGGAQDATRAFLESQPQPVLEKPLDLAMLATTIERLLAQAQTVSEAK